MTGERQRSRKAQQTDTATGSKINSVGKRERAGWSEIGKINTGETAGRTDRQMG